MKRNIIGKDSYFKAEQRYKQEQVQAQKELEERRNWKPNRSRVFIPATSSEAKQ